MKVFTLGDGETWDYKTIVRLLFSDDVILPPLAVIYTEDVRHAESAGADHVNVVLRTLVRGKGKTDGYHERVVPIPLNIASMMAFRSYEDYLASKVAELERDDDPS